MEYDIQLKDEKAIPVLSVRMRTSVDKLPEKLGEVYNAVICYLNELGEEAGDAAFCTYYNMDMQDLDVEAGFPVKKQLPGKGNIQSSEITAGKRVAVLYKGAYVGMVPAYEAVNTWIAKNGYRPTGVSREYYYNSPMDVPENELLTKIEIPVK